MLQGRLERPLLLLVAGTGALEPHYRTLVERGGLERCVRFLGFRQDLPALMKAADLFVLPSVAEAFGLVLAEALYLGVPVVASRVGGIPEIVTDGEDGVLVPPGDPLALAQAIGAVLGDSSLRARHAGAGRAKVVERFDFRLMVRAYEDAYESLCRS
jgi:glycosyltransferase involved in cell wall biosynthesis